MRIAYFSPLNPQKSGISDYSEVLIPSLEKFCDIDLWVSGINVTNPSLKKHKIIDYVRNKKSVNKLNNYDAIVYNMGNNPYYHSAMYEIFLKHPGFVILHDYILFYLITGYYLEFTQDRPRYIEELYYNYGLMGIDYAKEILKSRVPPLEYRNPEKYPLVKRLIENATGVITHSEHTRSLIIQQGAPESKVTKVNQVNYFNEANIPNSYDKKNLRAKYGISEDDILVASFGYIASTKRNLEVIKAINKIENRYNYKIKYLMVGEGGYVDGLLDTQIKKTGFIPLNEFEQLLYCTDIVANLRYPSMGETSATLLRAISASKPCIVTDDSWFSELPDNAVIKIPFGVNEMPSLVEALILLIESADVRKVIGKNAREYALEYHDPSKISAGLYKFIRDKLQQKGTISESFNQRNNHRLQEIGVASKCDLLSQLYRKINSDKINDLGLGPIKNIK